MSDTLQANLTESVRLLRSIRLWLGVVIVGLLISGMTAFPLQHELDCSSALPLTSTYQPTLQTLYHWLLRVDTALADTNARYPFLAYGTDWLAFAHLVIATAFIGPWIDPVRNKWFITWGLICCAGVPLLALIAGPIRGIPLYWRFIDTSFGLFCCPPLLILLRRIQRLEALTLTNLRVASPLLCFPMSVLPGGAAGFSTL